MCVWARESDGGVWLRQTENWNLHYRWIIDKYTKESFQLFPALCSSLHCCLPPSLFIACCLLFTLAGSFPSCQMSVLAVSNSPSLTSCFFLPVVSFMHSQSHLFSPSCMRWCFGLFEPLRPWLSAGTVCLKGDHLEGNWGNENCEALKQFKLRFEKCSQESILNVHCVCIVLGALCP